ncbi:MAG: ribosome-binding factor A [Candidatus Omnitrophica bacterium]|nr:ribosome-binding factor A [Candidatus Omnitrophota bacterium]
MAARKGLMKSRIARVEELIRRNILSILLTEVEGLNADDITVTRVELTKDLRLAKIFYICSDMVEDTSEIAELLTNNAKNIRYELAHRMTMKFMPRISFREDALEKTQRSVTELFKRLEPELGIEESEKGKEEENDEL